MKHKYGYIGHLCENVMQFVKWMVCAVIIGLFVGGIGTLFNASLYNINRIRSEHTWLIFFLPLGGLVIVFMYRHFLKEKDRGTNIVIDSMSSEEEISPILTPLIFIGTCITQLFGGSAGREGAALQMGGSMGNLLGKIIPVKESDKNVLVMCGMSACFASVFGTPMAAAIFPMEVVSIGVMYYASLIPCVCSAYVGYFVAKCSGFMPEIFHLDRMPAVNFSLLWKVFLIAMAGATVSGIFCYILHWTSHYFEILIKNQYLRIVVGGVLVIVLSLLYGTWDCNGAGMNVIARCFSGGKIAWWIFIGKMVLTAVTIGVGYKGGEIVPSMYIGTTMGVAISNVIGLDPAFGAAIGLLSVFCGVTNCPISSLLIGFELFNYMGAKYFLIAVAVSYTMSGYYGLYDSQKIVYSKFKTKYVNRQINNHM